MSWSGRIGESQGFKGLEATGFIERLSGRREKWHRLAKAVTRRFAGKWHC
jgi:hypothetical protein